MGVKKVLRQAVVFTLFLAKMVEFTPNTRPENVLCVWVKMHAAFTFEPFAMVGATIDRIIYTRA